MQILNEILANQIQQYLERIMHHDEFELIVDISNICKANQWVHHFQKGK